jgi:hypothetical protein
MPARHSHIFLGSIMQNERDGLISRAARGGGGDGGGDNANKKARLNSRASEKDGTRRK